MVSYFVIPVVFLLITRIGAPPVDQKKVTPTPSPAETASQEAMYNVEYERYLQEVVQLLESDDDFRKKLEKADPEDIKSGKIAEEMDFLNHNIRSKLNEIKRKEIDRLRELIREQVERENGAHNVVMPNHLDHINLDSFEKEDLRKLIFQTTRDLEELDKKRKEEFKEYEMEKELERRQKLANMTDEERQKAEKEHEESLKKHAEHPEVKHPGSKDQLEEVWEDVDKLPKDSFDPKTFFNLHDLTGDGYLDISELEALFQKELDKIYDKNNPDDDMRQREEEMARMREHVVKEMDHDKDGLISMEEFLGETKKDEFKKDPGWESIDEQPVYNKEEFEKFSAEWSKVHGVPPPAYVPPGYQQQQPPYPGQHQQQPYPGQPPYPGQQQPYPGQHQQPPYPGQPPYPYPGQGVPPQQQQQYPYPNQGQPQQYPAQHGGQQQQQYNPNQPPVQQQQGQFNQQQQQQQQPNVPHQQVPVQQQQQVPVQQQQVPVQQQQQVPVQQQQVPVQQQQVPVQNHQQQGQVQGQPIDNNLQQQQQQQQQQQPNVVAPVVNANQQPVH